jgi:hypothetical protein
VPLSKIQTEFLGLLASQRDPESYVAGATPLNVDRPRYSGDIDIFRDREERVAAAALSDRQVLEAAGYGVKWLRQLPLIYTAEIARPGAATRLPIRANLACLPSRKYRIEGMSPAAPPALTYYQEILPGGYTK